MWLNYGVPKLEGMTLSVLQTLESGVPYGASNLNNTSANGVNPRPFVTNPGYVTPPTGTNTIYFFTARDAYRTDGQKRTDLAVNYTYKLNRSRAELFGQLTVLNIFDNSQLCGCGGTDLLERRRRHADAHRHRGAHQRLEPDAVCHVQPVHDDAGRRCELGEGSELRDAAQPLRVHVTEAAPALVRD